jgi:hypothetical protein
MALGLYFQLGWLYWIIWGIIIILVLVGFLFLVVYGVSMGFYYMNHDLKTHCYYQPRDKKFAFSHILTKLDEAIFGGIGVLETDIITDTEKNTALEHRKNSPEAYEGNLGSFNLGNDEQVINFFYSYGQLRITWTYNQIPIITKYFKIKDIVNIGIQEQEEIATQMINLISENKNSIDNDYLKKNGMLIQNENERTKGRKDDVPQGL